MYANHKPWPVKYFIACKALFLCSILFVACKKSDKWIEVDPAFSQYIDAYTTGIISKTSSVRIRLAGTTGSVHTVGQPVTENLFHFSPSVKGKQCG